jgi:superfamily II DNA/RNA helicase
MTFSDLGLSREVLQAVEEAGYTQPTSIQEKAIPYVLMGRDILGSAQTGTGKTASFTLPMIDILAEGRTKARMPRSVILAPTRELAHQVAESFDQYGKYHKLSKALLIGGTSMAEQEQKLNRGADVLIATPGRMLDLFERGKILLADVKILVIDEADRMLDMGFIPDVERIVSLLPPIRQTLFFSATMPKEVRKLAERFLLNPKEISVSPPDSAADTVTQGLVRCPGQDKRKALQRLLATEDVASALIFCNRKRDVSALANALRKLDYAAGELHGDMAQPDRMATLQKFKSGEFNLLICSDVAARGLDIPAVSHVFNYDVPHSPDDYVHRIGRTGRAGREGRAVTIATPADHKALANIESTLKGDIPQIDLENVRILSREEVEESDGKAKTAENEAKTKRRRGGKRKKTATGRTSSGGEAPAAAANTNAPEGKPAAAAGEKAARSPAKAGNASARRDSGPGRKAATKPNGSSSAPETSNAPEKQQVPNGRRSKPFGDHTPAFILRPVRASAAA